jgi:hypothetical protein
VDPVDGAAVGLLDGHAYPIGYAGEEPATPEGQFRGFQSKAISVYDDIGLPTKEYGPLANLGPDQAKRVVAEIDRCS